MSKTKKKKSNYDRQAYHRYAEKKKAQGYVYKGMWIDINSLAALETFYEQAKAMNAANTPTAFRLGLRKATKLLQPEV